MTIERVERTITAVRFTSRVRLGRQLGCALRGPPCAPYPREPAVGIEPGNPS